MHRLKSLATIYRFRIAALLLCARWLMLPAIFVLLLVATATWDHQLAIAGIGVTGATGAVTILQWFLAARSGCPLCLTPVLARKSCMPHREARAFFGNHRLRVAVTILTRNSFDCPYCNEPTVLEVRPKSKHR